MMNRKRTPKVKFSTAPCAYCVAKKEPDYKEIAGIEQFTTDRGKILARSKTGVCRGHQRLLMIAVKRARHLALLPFVPAAQ